MNEIWESMYEFRLILPEKYQKNIVLFNQSIPSVDEGLNGTIPEKIRRFNNASNYLVKSISEIEHTCVGDTFILQLCRDVDSIYDNLYRQMIRNIYMELFVYQEKLLNIVCNIFFIEIQKNRQANLRELKKRSSNFPLLHKFCELCEQLRNDKKYNRVMSIRDDETHNMSQIDSFF